MLSLLLITALAVQSPQTSKPATDSTAPRRTTTAAPRGMSQSAIGRQAFHDRMRELWSDHIVYTRNLIVSATASLPDTAEVAQRLLRNQDEIGEAIKPYYGDAAGSQLASLLRNHIQLAAKTLIAAKGTNTPMPGMNMDASKQLSNRTSADIVADTSKAKQPNVRVRGDTMSQRVRPDTSAQSYTQNRDYKQSQQVAQVDSASLNQAIAALKANGDSIATFLSSANPRGFALETMRGAIQMHITLLLTEATAQIKKDYSGSLAAFDESQRQAMQMADMLSEGIMKQFPSRFNNRATTVSSR